MIFLGIDPGKTGGIAGVDADGKAVRWCAMPITEADILMELEAYKGFAQDIKCVLEFVSASPKMGTVSAFTFGSGFGGLKMALTATNIPFVMKTPKTWQTTMQCLSGGDKHLTYLRAQQLFPTVKITNAIADSLLLAEFCRRFERGKP